MTDLYIFFLTNVVVLKPKILALEKESHYFLLGFKKTETSNYSIPNFCSVKRWVRFSIVRDENVLAAAETLFENRRKPKRKVPQRHPAAALQFRVGPEQKALCKIRKASVLCTESELLQQHRREALLGRW